MASFFIDWPKPLKLIVRVRIYRNLYTYRKKNDLKNGYLRVFSWIFIKIKRTLTVNWNIYVDDSTLLFQTILT